jgi:hypothetical protein
LADSEIEHCDEQVIALELIANAELLTRLQEEEPGECLELLAVPCMFRPLLEVKVLHGSIEFLQEVCPKGQLPHQLS